MKNTTRRLSVAVAAALGLAALLTPTASATSASRGPSTPPASSQAERPASFYEKRSSEIQAYLEQHFTEVVPQATSLDVQRPAGDSGEFADDMGYLFHWILFDNGSDHSGVALQYDEPGHFDVPSDELCEQDPDTTSCTSETLPDGSELVTRTIDIDDQRKLLAVNDYRPDGSVVWVDCPNYDPILSHNGTPQKDFPVSREQLVTLVTDPALGL